MVPCLQHPERRRGPSPGRYHPPRHCSNGVWPKHGTNLDGSDDDTRKGEDCPKGAEDDGERVGIQVSSSSGALWFVRA